MANADLSRCVFVVMLAVLFLCAPTIASTQLNSRPHVGHFSSSPSKSASTLIKSQPRSNDFSRSASKSNTSSDPSIADEWDEVFDTARSVLAKLPDPARIETTIKDPALRQSVLRAYQSLKTRAKVSRVYSRATKQGMLAEFERDFESNLQHRGNEMRKGLCRRAQKAMRLQDYRVWIICNEMYFRLTDSIDGEDCTPTHPTLVHLSESLLRTSSGIHVTFGRTL